LASSDTDISNHLQIFIDSVWYCRLLVPKNTKCKCFEEHEKLPPLVTAEELRLMISIQIVALLSCVVEFNLIRFAGDRVISALGLKSYGKSDDGLERL